jgi:hypothetical protein
MDERKRKMKTKIRGYWPNKKTIGLELIDEEFEPTQGRKKGVSLYGGLFNELANNPLGTKAIVCEDQNKAKAVGYALTRWIRTNNMGDVRAAIQTKDGSHKVWLVPKDA